ncbi:MAG TPA: toll/interleukin-1 receptor domain-containing protein [Jatrophihabitans sp.]|jgi:hypothetical protein|uniref:toll/interleukin-1 receptor domain-containing protein n=1 Tax=Jatrophihabitans sp. TaxID=1932789 RepID=UPI002F1C9D8E
MVYRLFLSHSSPSSASKERLRELAASIEEAAEPHGGIRVLYDQEQITGGDDWRRRIAFMLHVCHGGVVLLDEAALASQWVHAEALFLSLRHSYDEAFAFVPVSFLDEPDLERARQARAAQRQAFAETSWKVVNLPGIQFVRGKGVTEVATSIVTALRDRGLLGPGETPAAQLANQLAPLLDRASQPALRELADGLSARAGYLADNAENLAALAIIEAMLRSECLTETRDLMKDFGTAFPNPLRLRILEELSPLVVAAGASAMLRRRRSRGGYAHASLCSERPGYTVPRYIRRAHLAQEPPPHFAIANTHGAFEELRANLRDGWRARHGSAMAQSLTDEDVDELLATSTPDLYVWVPGPIDEEVLELLDETYPRVAFLVHHQASAAPPTLPAQLLPVTPTLTSQDERRIYFDYLAAIQALEGDSA